PLCGGAPTGLDRPRGHRRLAGGDPRIDLLRPALDRAKALAPASPLDPGGVRPRRDPYARCGHRRPLALAAGNRDRDRGATRGDGSGPAAAERRARAGKATAPDTAPLGATLMARYRRYRRPQRQSTSALTAKLCALAVVAALLIGGVIASQMAAGSDPALGPKAAKRAKKASAAKTGTGTPDPYY